MFLVLNMSLILCVESSFLKCSQRYFECSVFSFEYDLKQKYPHVPSNCQIPIHLWFLVLSLVL